MVRTDGLVGPLRLRAKSWYMAMMRNVLALAMGRYEGIEEAIERAHHPDDPNMAWDAEVSYRLARYTLARERGDMERILPLLVDQADRAARLLAVRACPHLRARVARSGRCAACCCRSTSGRPCPASRATRNGCGRWSSSPTRRYCWRTRHRPGRSWSCCCPTRPSRPPLPSRSSQARSAARWDASPTLLGQVGGRRRGLSEALVMCRADRLASVGGVDPSRPRQVPACGPGRPGDAEAACG